MEVDESDPTPQHEDIPPQLMFLHQGQSNIKELRFHPYYREMVITTAEDSYNIFRPNLEPEEDEEQEVAEGSSAASTTTDQEESKHSEKSSKKHHGSNYYVDSDEDDELEEKRMYKAAKKLNKKSKGGSNAPGKRSKKD